MGGWGHRWKKRVLYQDSVCVLDSSGIMRHCQRGRNFVAKLYSVALAAGVPMRDVTMQRFLVNRRTRLANLISILEGVSLVQSHHYRQWMRWSDGGCLRRSR